VNSAAVLALVAMGCSGDSAAEFTYDYTIPLGSGDAADRGEIVGICPERLDARVGDSLRIVNDDDRAHVLGPYTVAAGQVLTQEFTTVGTHVGVCSTRPGYEFVLSVGD
jgi:hypothetical protein